MKDSSLNKPVITYNDMEKILNQGKNPLVELCKKFGSSEFVLNTITNMEKHLRYDLFNDEHILEFIDVAKDYGDINVTDKDGNGILHIFPFVKVIEKMASLGANIDLENKYNHTALACILGSSTYNPDTPYIPHYNYRYSIWRDNIGNIIKTFLKNGADPNKGDVVMKVISRFSIEMEDEFSLYDAGDYEVVKGTIDLIELAVQHGADINCRNHEDHPLSSIQNPYLLDAFFRLGADPNSDTKVYIGQNTPTIFKCLNPPLRPALDPANYITVPLLWKAVLERDMFKVKELLKHGADVNTLINFKLPAIDFLPDNIDVMELLPDDMRLELEELKEYFVQRQETDKADMEMYER